MEARRADCCHGESFDVWAGWLSERTCVITARGPATSVTTAWIALRWCGGMECRGGAWVVGMVRIG